MAISGSSGTKREERRLSSRGPTPSFRRGERDWTRRASRLGTRPSGSRDAGQRRRRAAGYAVNTNAQPGAARGGEPAAPWLEGSRLRRGGARLSPTRAKRTGKRNENWERKLPAGARARHPAVLPRAALICAASDDARAATASRHCGMSCTPRRMTVSTPTTPRCRGGLERDGGTDAKGRR